MAQAPSPKVLFVGTEDGAFCQHRLPMARALKAAGFDVHVCARESHHRARIEAEGFVFIPWNVHRGSLNPLREWVALWDLRRIIRTVQPDVLVNVALKPILYAGLALQGKSPVVTLNLFAGLGAVFINPRPVMKAVQIAILPLLRHVLARDQAWLVTQNSDNLSTLHALRVGHTTRSAVIPGSGIDLEAFPQCPEPSSTDPVVVTLLARMLWDKGIAETLEAARILERHRVNVRIDLVGAPDPHNPAAVPEATLRALPVDGIVKWQGPTQDPRGVWAASHIALLPSYGEGMPKSLLEAAATGRPLIAFDAPGARDLVRNGHNGLLVRFKDVAALAEAIKTLAENGEQRRAMGAAARQTVEQTFSAQKVGAAFVQLVKTALRSSP